MQVKSNPPDQFLVQSLPQIWSFSRIREPGLPVSADLRLAWSSPSRVTDGLANCRWHHGSPLVLLERGLFY
jgi:hypothetical protein